MSTTNTCAHCQRAIVLVDGAWVDPEAAGDDSLWRETCDSHDTFVAEHEPVVSDTDRRIAVLQAIDAFVAMANAHPSTPHHDWGVTGFQADTPGQKVTRIVMGDLQADGSLKARSVHCFVDNLTGDVFKAAGWKAPAKSARYNLVHDFDEVERNFYWTGSYLYADWKRK